MSSFEHIEIFCTEEFFDNNVFYYYLTNKNNTKHTYLFPTLLYHAKTDDLKFYESEHKQKYFDRLIIHELCHIFRNFLSGNYAEMKMKNHGLTVKGYVSNEDLITEIETSTLQDFILNSVNNKLLCKADYDKSLKYLNDNCLMKRSKSRLDDLVDINQEYWKTVGIDRLKLKFDDMINFLKEK